MGTATRTLKEKAYQQTKEFLLIALYLWLVLGLLVVHKSVVLAEHNIDYTYHGFALINALALAKVMLVVRDLHLGERFDEEPLIYPTLFKTGLYTVVLAIFKIFEDSAVGLYRHQSFQRSIEDIGGGTWRGILTVTLLLFVVLIPFVAFGELRRVLGEQKLKEMFFGARA